MPSAKCSKTDGQVNRQESTDMNLYAGIRTTLHQMCTHGSILADIDTQNDQAEAGKKKGRQASRHSIDAAESAI